MEYKRYPASSFTVDDLSAITPSMWDYLKSRGVDKEASVGVEQSRKNISGKAFAYYKGRFTKRTALYFYRKKGLKIKRQSERHGISLRAGVYFLHREILNYSCLGFESPLDTFIPSYKDNEDGIFECGVSIP